MAHSVLTQYNSPNYTPAAQVPGFFGYPRVIEFIVIHWWGDPNAGPSFEGVVAWLCNPRSQVSAHDVTTGTGRRVAIIVDYINAAWHSGSALGNAKGLGFELDPRCRQEDYEVAAEDIAATWKFYGRIIPLRPHNSFKATACPGNYDLGRLHAMALAIYTGASTPKATVAEVKQAYRDILEREVESEGVAQGYVNTGKSIGEIRNILLNSPEKAQLEARKAAEYAKNEWVRNLKPYTNGDDKFEQTVKLAVIPADGIKRYNLENGTLVNNEVIPKGTIIDIVAKTHSAGKNYLISSYSKKNGQAVGLLADQLAVPAQPPVQEKPEWLKNLNDIADKDFWTRSLTPVLNLEDGSVVDNYPINKKVRITHATSIVGKDLLVIDGQKHAIETLYLSDKPIAEPDSDLDKENNNILKQILAIVQAILSKLTNIFK